MKFRIHYLAGFMLFAATFNISQAQTALNDSIRIEKIISKLQNKNLRGQVIIVKNPADVAFLNSFINKKAKEPWQRDRTHIINDRKTPGGRYKLGDKKAIPQVLKILNSGNNDAIDELLTDMTQEYEDRLRPYTLDEAVKSKIFALIAVPELESSVIYYLSRQNIDGRIKLFEDRLLSGKSSQESSLIDELSNEKAISDRVVEYLHSSNKKNPEEITFFKNTMLILGKTGGSNRKKILDILYGYLDNHPFEEKDFVVHEIDTATIDTAAAVVEEVREDSTVETAYEIPKYPKGFLLDIVSSFGDQRNTAIQKKLKDFVAKHPEFKENKNIKAYVEQLPERVGDLAYRRAKLLEMLQKKEGFYSYLTADEELKKDSELQVKVLRTHEEVDDINNYFYIDRIKSDFSFLDANAFRELINKSIKSEDLRNKFLIENYVLNQKIKWLSDNGFQAKTLTPQQKTEFLKDISEYYSDGFFTALDISGIGINLTPEHVKQSENYNVLIEKIINLSGGKINNVKSCIQLTYDDYFKKSGPRAFVSYKDKCYILIPEQFMDFSEVGLIRLILDDIVKDSGITQRYYFLDSNMNNETYGEYCLFGEPKLIQNMILKSGIATSRNPHDDYDNVENEE